MTSPKTVRPKSKAGSSFVSKAALSKAKKSGGAGARSSTYKGKGGA